MIYYTLKSQLFSNLQIKYISLGSSRNRWKLVATIKWQSCLYHLPFNSYLDARQRKINMLKNAQFFSNLPTIFEIYNELFGFWRRAFKKIIYNKSWTKLQFHICSHFLLLAIFVINFCCFFYFEGRIYILDFNS